MGPWTPKPRKVPKQCNCLIAKEAFETPGQNVDSKSWDPDLGHRTLDTSTPDADFSHFQLILADFSARGLQGLALGTQEPWIPPLRTLILAHFS